MTQSGDRQLEGTVRLAQAGDREALEDLLEGALDPLVAFVRARAGGAVVAHESVHDIVQSVCREVLVDLSKMDYRGDRKFKSWLFLLATRKILDRKRFICQERRDVRRETPIHGANSLLDGFQSLVTPSRHASAREELERIEGVLQELPDAQREAVAYSRLLGLETSEIAERMETTDSAVRSLIYRGLARIAELLNTTK